jgi:hypothetical protein
MDVANLLVAAMPLVRSTPAVALVPCVADLILTVAHFSTSQWFQVRCVATLMLAEGPEATRRQEPPTAAGRGKSFVYPKHRTGHRASTLCLLCHFHLKICVDSAVTSLVGFISFPLVMARGTVM